MSLGLTCDACGDALLATSDVRYVVKIQGFAAYDVMEITREDLAGDLERQFQRLRDELERRDASELEDEVFREFQFDLCPACWRRYLRRPLEGARPPGTRDDPPDTSKEKKSQGN